MRILDVRRQVSYTDYLVIASGRSDVHVQALTDAVAEATALADVAPLHREGVAVAQWVVLDYGDVVVHIMQPEQREFYGLERLWADAPVAPGSPTA